MSMLSQIWSGISGQRVVFAIVIFCFCVQEIPRALAAGHRFEFKLLEELGYGFDLLVDGHSGQDVCEDRWYHYHQEYGLVEQRAATEPDKPLFAGIDLLAMARGERSEPVRSASKRLLRLALAGHLGDKPLKSRELFRQTAPRS